MLDTLKRDIPGRPEKHKQMPPGKLLNQQDQSIEYVKEFQINGDFVKVAIRISNKGTFFVRSLYALNKNRVSNFISKGTLKKVNK